MSALQQWYDAIFARVHAWTARAATRHALRQPAGLPLWAGPNDTICDTLSNVWAVDTHICDTTLTPNGVEPLTDSELPSPWARTICARPPQRRKALPR